MKMRKLVLRRTCRTLLETCARGTHTTHRPHAHTGKVVKNPFLRSFLVATKANAFYRDAFDREFDSEFSWLLSSSDEDVVVCAPRN